MRHIRTASVLTVATLAASLAALARPALAVPARSFAAISGAGTSWSSVAIDQWAHDVQPSGLVVKYIPDGSAFGRVTYIEDQYDFAASDPPFRSGLDKLGGTGREVVPYSYSYVPDLAGGTAFLYHIDVKGHLYTHLKLTGETLTEIFTGQITNWDNPQITKETGTQLPSLAITPVLHSEGAGDTWFFSRYMATMFTSQWNAFCLKVHPGLRLPCGPTEFYPPFGNAKSEDGSVQVVNYIRSSFGNGAIGYDEYTYALSSHLPAVAMGNAAGKYVLPTAANVTTALTRAIIDENPKSKNFLQQDLDRVYANPAPTSYPLSGYSYLIVPRSGAKLPPPPIFTRAAGRSLSTFIVYALCKGQKQLAQLGYAPLPAALVKGGLEQAGHIPGHVSASCST